MAEEHSLMYLREALEEKILVRLPVKSIVRFTSVCKRWHSRLRSKAFGELYFGSLDKEAFIPRRKDLGLISPDLIPRGERSKRSVTSVIGPLSNGIYASTSSGKFICTLKIALFNPATKRVTFADFFPDEYFLLLSGIPPIGCNVSCGIDDDYRVVVLIDYQVGGVGYSRRCFLVFLYTWRTGEWEKLVDYDPRGRKIGDFRRGADVFKDIASVYGNMMTCSQKLLNGCWHWMIAIERKTEFGVLSFDFERNLLEVIHGPPRESTLEADVFVLQDHLASIVVDSYKIEIWRKTKNTWTNIYSVNSTQFVRLSGVIVHDVDYYQVEEEVRIRRLILVEGYIRHTFDDNMVHLVEEFNPSNRKISLSVGGISKFTPTFEPLPLTILK